MCLVVVEKQGKDVQPQEGEGWKIVSKTLNGSYISKIRHSKLPKREWIRSNDGFLISYNEIEIYENGFHVYLEYPSCHNLPSADIFTGKCIVKVRYRQAVAQGIDYLQCKLIKVVVAKEILIPDTEG